eukprot:gene9697-biopygen8608
MRSSASFSGDQVIPEPSSPARKSCDLTQCIGRGNDMPQPTPASATNRSAQTFHWRWGCITGFDSARLFGDLSGGCGPMTMMMGMWADDDRDDVDDDEDDDDLSSSYLYHNHHPINNIIILLSSSSSSSSYHPHHPIIVIIILSSSSYHHHHKPI